MDKPIRLEHVGVYAQGEAFEKTVEFYKQAFGWRVFREMDQPWQIVFLADGAGGVLELLNAPGAPIPGPSHLSFAVPREHYDELKARLEGMGIAFDAPMEMPSGDVIAYFNDPAGNRAQIVGRATAWDTTGGA